MAVPHTLPDRIGPVLYLRGGDAAEMRLRALVAVRDGGAAPMLDAGHGPAAMPVVARRAGFTFHTADFALPAAPAARYAVDGATFDVRTDVAGDLRIGYVSCNGEEHGDLDRDGAERDAMWAALGRAHDAAPLSILLQGGDQVYADEDGRAHPLAEGWPDALPGPLSAAQRAEVYAALEAAFTARYLTLYARPEFAYIAARVPTLAMWDDHDICDGWGSLRADALDSDLGQTLFAVARAAFLLFQRGEGGATVSCALGAHVDLPGLRIAAPDLRSERRPERVMGPEGWRQAAAMLAAPAPERVLVMSSVPALGPRLSVVETLVNRTGLMRKYSDDLRDQWQSHAHRAEWQRFLRALSDLHAGGAATTVLSGEIHLATRATMATPAGPLHQLVASGIAHTPPPRGFARALGLLARFGEAPLRGQPIRLHPLPGRRRIYTDERNFLMLERTGGAWQAIWHLEESGATDPLPI